MEKQRKKIGHQLVCNGCSLLVWDSIGFSPVCEIVHCYQDVAITLRTVGEQTQNVNNYNLHGCTSWNGMESIVVVDVFEKHRLGTFCTTIWHL